MPSPLSAQRRPPRLHTDFYAKPTNATAGRGNAFTQRARFCLQARDLLFRHFLFTVQTNPTSPIVDRMWQGLFRKFRKSPKGHRYQSMKCTVNMAEWTERALNAFSLNSPQGTQVPFRLHDVTEGKLAVYFTQLYKTHGMNYYESCYWFIFCGVLRSSELESLVYCMIEQCSYFLVLLLNKYILHFIWIISPRFNWLLTLPYESD